MVVLLRLKLTLAVIVPRLVLIGRLMFSFGYKSFVYQSLEGLESPAY